MDKVAEVKYQYLTELLELTHEFKFRKLVKQIILTEELPPQLVFQALEEGYPEGRISFILDHFDPAFLAESAKEIYECGARLSKTHEGINPLKRSLRAIVGHVHKNYGLLDVLEIVGSAPASIFMDESELLFIRHPRKKEQALHLYQTQELYSGDENSMYWILSFVLDNNPATVSDAILKECLSKEGILKELACRELKDRTNYAVSGIPIPERETTAQEDEILQYFTRGELFAI